MVTLQFKGHKLDKKDFFGKSDPFLVFYRCNEDNRLVNRNYKIKILGQLLCFCAIFHKLGLPVLQTVSWMIVMTEKVNGRLRHFTMSFRGSIRTDRQEPGENKLVMLEDQ